LAQCVDLLHRVILLLLLLWLELALRLLFTTLKSIRLNCDYIIFLFIKH